MRLLEYESKKILESYGIATPDGIVITKKSSIDAIRVPAVLKSQVPIGGRGKLGGVVVVDNAAELQQHIATLFALAIKGFIPTAILAEEKIAIQNEHYLSLLIDRDSGTIRLVAHKNGGIDVEDNHAEGFFNIEINERTFTTAIAQLSTYFHYTEATVAPFIHRLYDVFVCSDATLLEINPLIYTKTNELMCGDCKMELDDAARFRHPDWQFEQTTNDTNFVTLDADGTIATIANGAGLAMATVDAVADAGMAPANFLDIGGGANTASVLAAFQQIDHFPHIHAIVINIFAGITRCDEVAKAIIAAKQQMPALPPLYIRLAGTNFEEAVALLAAENISTLNTLEECIGNAKEAAHA